LLPSFFYAIVDETILIMDRDKLKLMVRNLELLVDDIKAEVFSDVESYVAPPPSISQDYDEILEDDDGYPD
jgi:hypothetical protein